MVLIFAETKPEQFDMICSSKLLAVTFISIKNKQQVLITTESFLLLQDSVPFPITLTGRLMKVEG